MVIEIGALNVTAGPSSQYTWEPAESDPLFNSFLHKNLDQVPDNPNPSTGDLWEAAFTLDHDYAAYRNKQVLVGDIARQEEWHPSFDLGMAVDSTKDKYTHEERMLLYQSNGPQEFAGYEQLIGQRRENERMLNEQGFLKQLMYRGVAGMTSFSTIATLGMPLYKAGTTGVRALGSAMGYGAAAGAVYEGSMLAIDPLRETEEAMYGMAGATFMGGVLGGAFSRLAAKKSAAELLNRAADDVYERASVDEANAMIRGADDLNNRMIWSPHNQEVEIVGPHNVDVYVPSREIVLPPVEMILPETPAIVLRQVPELLDANGNVLRPAAQEVVANDIPMPDRPLLSPTQSTGAAQVMDNDLYDPRWLAGHEAKVSGERVPLQEKIFEAETAVPTTWRTQVTTMQDAMPASKSLVKTTKQTVKNIERRKDTPENREAMRVAKLESEKATQAHATLQQQYDTIMNKIDAKVETGAKGAREQLKLLDRADLAARTVHAKDYTGLVKSGWVAGATGGVFRKMSPAKLAKAWGFTAGRSDTSWSPGARILLSDNPEAKVMYEKLANNELLLNKNVPREGWDGAPAKRSAESARNLDVERAAVDSRRILSEGWASYAKAQGQRKSFNIGDFRQFRKEVGRGLNDPDKVTDPNVKAAVDKTRAMMQNVEDKLVEMELIPHKFRVKIDGEEKLLTPKQYESALNKAFEAGEVVEMIEKVAAIPKGDTMYVPRIWNRHMIERNGLEFQEHIRFKLWENVDQHKVQRLPLHEQAAEKIRLADTRTAQVQEFYDAIVHSQHGNIDTQFFDQPAKTMHFKDRAMPIQREWMDDTDFLVNDAQIIMDNYMRSVLPQMRVLEAFGGTDIAIKHIYAAVNRRFTDNINEATEVATAAGKSEDYIKRMKNNMAKEGTRRIKDLEHVHMRTLGLNPHPSGFRALDRGIRAVKAWNVVTKLGGMIVSAFPDPALIAMRHGLTKLVPAVGRYAKNHAKALAMANWKGNRQQYKDMSLIFEVKLNTTMDRIANMDEYGNGGMFDEAISTGTHIFSNTVLMGPWNQMWKEIAAEMVSLDTKRILAKGGKKSERLLLERGFSPEEANTLRTVVSQEGALFENGVPNWDHAAWNPQTRDSWARMLKEAADTAILTPGAGDMPRAMHHPLGQVFFQFASFPMTVMTKAIAPMIQRGEYSQVAFASMAMLLPLAALTEYTKNALAGRETDFEDPNTWSKIIAHRTGALGYYSNLYEYGDSLLDLDHNLWGEAPSTFWERKGAGRSVSGPTARLGGDIMGSWWAVHDMLNGKTPTKAQYRHMRGIAPYQNSWQLKAIERLTDDD